MKIRSYKYHIKQGAKNISKNGLMSVASIASVAACAFILIISLCIAINLDRALEKAEESIGLSLYLGDDVNDEEIKMILDKLYKIPNITNVNYMSKEDALNWAKNEWKDNQDILSGFEDDNPFPRSFEISVDGAKNQKQVIKDVTILQKEFETEFIKKRKEETKDIIENSISDTTTQTTTQTQQSISQVTTQVVNEDKKEDVTDKTASNIDINDKNYKFIGIERIRHSQRESDILLAINNTIRISSIVILIIFAVISVTIIINTIKLTVYVRKTEINIMKYVGATDWFIRWPFVIEGIIIGVIGSLIPIIVSILGYNKVVNLIYEKVPFITNYIGFKDTLSMFLAIAPVTIILGILLGVIGSASSIKKHLNV